MKRSKYHQNNNDKGGATEKKLFPVRYGTSKYGKKVTSERKFELPKPSLARPNY